MKELKTFLKQKFGYPDFKIGQEETIKTVLEKNSALAILPTGTGKSLCYQFLGKYLECPVLIVSPLISLMQDQVEQLRYQGEKAVIALNSNLNHEQKQLALKNLAHFKFIYVSPEMLTSNELLAHLRSLNIGLFVVDEAHCISKWGPDFRPDYLNLGNLKEKLQIKRTLALTATATKRVEQDILKELRLKEAPIIRYPVDRNNIFLEVQKFTTPEEKQAYLLEKITSAKGPGIIYFSSKQKAEEINLKLLELGLSSAVYHAGLDLNERYLIQQQFLNDQLEIVCATSAFGMGINKQNIRYVIHYHLPSDLESYVQEIGRCARDGKKGNALLLYSPDDLARQRFILEKNLPDTAQIHYFYQKRQVLASFKTEEAELLQRLIATGKSEQELIAMTKLRKEEKELALKSLLAYLDESQCKRRLIASYFGDSPLPKHYETGCCSCGNGDSQLFQMKRTRKSASPKIELGYEKYLARLFAKDRH